MSRKKSATFGERQAGSPEDTASAAGHTDAVNGDEPSGSYRDAIRRGFLNVTVGWGVWFRNRQVGLRDRWFRLRTIRSYRGAPQP